MRNNSKTKRTEAALSLLVTCALVITLAIAVASAIKKGNDTDTPNNNFVNLNETEGGNLTADNSNNATVGNTDTPNSNTNTMHPTRDSEFPSLTANNNTPADEELTEEDNGSAEEPTEAPQVSDVPVGADTSVGTGYSFSEADTLSMPVAGDIILSYSMDSTIWFPTLGVYKCNPGLYIGGEVGTSVTASASGTVDKITINEELGNVVTIDMGNGYKATYGQLDNIAVSEGEVVLAGSVIGTVANPTIYYTTEGSGVYFELTKEGSPANPLEYME